MKGAREYADLFKTGQYGKLYIVSGYHARGKTFQIFVLPEGVVETPNRCYPLCDDAVEVYGIIGGQPGWTEEYGWLHKGKWCEDFEQLVIKARKATEEKSETEKQKKAEAATKQEQRIQTLLKNY